MYHRILSFETGLIKCKAIFDNKPCLAEKVSKLTANDIRRAVQAHKLGRPCDYKDSAQYFLKAVETSCRPISHFNEAAKYAREIYVIVESL